MLIWHDEEKKWAWVASIHGGRPYSVHGYRVHSEMTKEEIKEADENTKIYGYLPVGI